MNIAKKCWKCRAATESWIIKAMMLPLRSSSCPPPSSSSLSQHSCLLPTPTSHSIPASIEYLLSLIALCFPAPLELSFLPSAHLSASAVSHPQHQLLPFTSHNSNPSQGHSLEQSARDSTHPPLSAKVSNPIPPIHQRPRPKMSPEQQPTSQIRRH